MATYIKAGPEVQATVDELLHTHFTELVDAGVRIGLLMAHAPRDADGQPKGPALKHHGWPAAAIVKINSLQDRVEGKPDCTIRIDGDPDGWPAWSEERRKATLHHELTHIELRHDEEGAVLLDDAFRPKLKLRPHDAEIGCFYSIAEHYGDQSFEGAAYVDMHRKMSQMTFPFG